MTDPSTLEPPQARALFRAGLQTPTAGWAPGFTQANLIALPRSIAYDFLLFAQRNPKSCPVLDVIDAGSVTGPLLGEHGDIRTDLPLYRVYRKGVLIEECTDVTEFWREDLVSFLIGCSFTFEAALIEAGVPVRHIEQRCNVPMYRTSLRSRSAGSLSGPMVVSMRPIPGELVPTAIRVTSRYPAVHGAPVHVGDPTAIGIDDVGIPDFGDPVQVRPGEIPVFWACGVTPQAAVTESAPELAIGHAPGHMAITDARDSDYLSP